MWLGLGFLLNEVDYEELGRVVYFEVLFLVKGIRVWSDVMEGFGVGDVFKVLKVLEYICVLLLEIWFCIIIY